jgi:hypothetical protein
MSLTTKNFIQNEENDNEELRNLSSSPDTITVVKLKMVRVAGHASRLEMKNHARV